MSGHGDNKASLNADLLKQQTSAKISPLAVSEKPPESADRPLFTDTSATGLAGSGMIGGRDIIALRGKTYGDTDISLDNADTRARIDRAKSVIPKDKTEIYDSSDKMAAFFDTFAARIHQSDVVGDYFPAVLELQARQREIMVRAEAAVFSPGAVQAMAELDSMRDAQNGHEWKQREPDGAVRDAAVVSIETRNTETETAILSIKKDAAAEVLGEIEAAKIEAEARDGLDAKVSDTEVEARVVAHLVQAAAEKKLPEVEAVMRTEAKAEGKEFQTHAELKAKEEALWDQKHATQKDFADAIKDGNPDCTEYANLTAVTLAESDIPNVSVAGHVMNDSDFPIVGAHAYNLILDKSGSNVIGVFEGTATSGTFKQVMNKVSLEEFQAGKTLVTFNDESGWSTYGTGAPANGKPLNGWTDDNKLVSNVIEAADVALIAQAKQDYLRDMKPEVVADQIIDMYKQYGDRMKVQGWIDNARDDGNPAFAQAAQLMHDYKGGFPPPESLKTKITEVVRGASERAQAQGDYGLAVTPEDIASFESGASNSMAADLQLVLSKVPDARLDGLEGKHPWLKEVRDVLKDVKTDYTDALVNSDRKALDAYARVSDIIRDNDVSARDFSEVSGGMSEDKILSLRYGG